MKLSSQGNDVEMYSMHNDGKSVVAEWFFIALRNKISKYLNICSTCNDFDVEIDIKRAAAIDTSKLAKKANILA